jgi:hypothetical protein
MLHCGAHRESNGARTIDDGAILRPPPHKQLMQGNTDANAWVDEQCVECVKVQVGKLQNQL